MCFLLVINGYYSRLMGIPISSSLNEMQIFQIFPFPTKDRRPRRERKKSAAILIHPIFYKNTFSWFVVSCGLNNIFASQADIKKVEKQNKCLYLNMKQCITIRLLYFYIGTVHTHAHTFTQKNPIKWSVLAYTRK